MKRIHVWVAVSLFFSLQSTAQDQMLKSETTYSGKVIDLFELKEISGGKIQLRLSNSSGERVTLSISDHGYQIWQGTTTERLVEKTFDLSNLEDGDYLIQVQRGKERLQKNLRIETTTNTLRRQLID